MNQILIFTLTSTTKRQVYLVVTSLAIIASLPVMAVFGMGSAAVSVLANSSSDDSTDSISITTQGVYEGNEIAGDTYAWGNCTYWAFALRLKAGDPIPTSWGNANTWDDQAQADGYNVDHIPEPGAVFQTDTGDLGHVAYVTAVDPITGDWTISEMNAQGLDIIDLRVFKALAEEHYNFIHDKVQNGL